MTHPAGMVAVEVWTPVVPADTAKRSICMPTDAEVNVGATTADADETACVPVKDCALIAEDEEMLPAAATWPATTLPLVTRLGTD